MDNFKVHVKTKPNHVQSKTQSKLYEKLMQKNLFEFIKIAFKHI